MTNKERAELRSKAMLLKPIFQVGKNGITDNQVVAIDNSLEALELIKINVLSSASDEVLDIGNELANRTSSTLIQVVGNKITLYRKAEKKTKKARKK